MPKNPNDETINVIKSDFKPAHSKLQKLQLIYNPSKSNLHFHPLKKANSELFTELLELSN
tara:strand:+ start:1273 stop:1452 length:180 start_codon:yes stop_codon:yes gene_type:complete